MMIITPNLPVKKLRLSRVYSLSKVTQLVSGRTRICNFNLFEYISWPMADIIFSVWLSGNNAFSFCFKLIDFIFWSNFRFIEKLIRKYREFPYTSLPLPLFPNNNLSLVWCICYNWWASIDTLLLTNSIVYIRVPILSCTVILV